MRFLCQTCGEPMPNGEQMFRSHGYSGPCPKPPLTTQPRDAAEGAHLLSALQQIKIVCVDNAATTVRHDLALEFVGSIASRALSPAKPIITEDDGTGDPLPEGWQPPTFNQPAAPPKPAPDAMRALEAARPYVLRRLLEAKEDFERDVLAQIDAALAAPVPPADGAKGGFAFPQIVIDWNQINAQQFEMSRAHLLAKLTRFMSPESKETAYWSDNHFTRSDMYVLHELLKAAIALSPSSGTGAAEPPRASWAFMSQEEINADKRVIGAGGAEPVAWRWRNRRDGAREDASAWHIVSSRIGNSDNVIAEPLYATPPVRRDREAIARIIGGDIFGSPDSSVGPATQAARKSALEKADAILSLPVQPGAGERS